MGKLFGTLSYLYCPGSVVPGLCIDYFSKVLQNGPNIFDKFIFRRFVCFVVSKVRYLSPQPRHLAMRWVPELYSLRLDEYSFCICFPVLANNLDRIFFIRQCESLEILWIFELIWSSLNAASACLTFQCLDAFTSFCRFDCSLQMWIARRRYDILFLPSIDFHISSLLRQISLSVTSSISFTSLVRLENCKGFFLEF